MFQSMGRIVPEPLATDSLARLMMVVHAQKRRDTSRAVLPVDLG